MRTKRMTAVKRDLRVGDNVLAVGTVTAVDTDPLGRTHVTLARQGDGREDRLDMVGEAWKESHEWYIDRPVPSRNTKLDVVKRNRRAWVKALRSGQFPQGSGRLAYQDNVGDGTVEYCCLGVACEVANVTWWKPIFGGSFHLFTIEGNEGIPTDDVLAKFGLDEHQATVLASVNDSEGLSFSEIADLIEKDPKFGIVPQVVSEHSWRQLAR